MKKPKMQLFHLNLAIIVILMLVIMSACTPANKNNDNSNKTDLNKTSISKTDDKKSNNSEDKSIQVPKEKEEAKSTGKIYLYGETHGIKAILNRELELWKQYYDEGMRNMFVELPYYTAQFLNLWIKATDDEILNVMYEDWKGSSLYNPNVLNFYKQIKADFPETIFHGVDVGHQYASTGNRYLKYLEDNLLKDSDEYRLATEAIEQGKHFYESKDYGYRENKMYENFIREFDALKDQDIMGIFGSMHVGINDMAYRSNNAISLANQLHIRYTDNLRTEDISHLKDEIEPISSKQSTINGKEYKLLYFGEEDISKFVKQYSKRRFYRIENAYDDFAKLEKSGDILPFNNYPTMVKEGDVFLIEYVKIEDDSVEQKYYINMGKVWNNAPATEEVLIK